MPENINNRTKHYLEAYKITNQDVLEDSEIEELNALIKFYEEKEEAH